MADSISAPPRDPREPDAYLTPSQRDERIRLLASSSGETRCRAALELCHATWAGTDIACAVPELARVADLPSSTDLDAMWAQHALQAAAFHGADLRPALPTLVGTLEGSGSIVDHRAAHALRTWASRSTEAAAEALAAVRDQLTGRSVFGAKELLAELEFLSEHLIPDAEATWTTDQPRGVRVSAGRLNWRTRHGWDLDQSIPDFIQDGVPRERLRHETSDWRVPIEIQNQVRGWLGLPPLVETEQERALRRIERSLADLAAATFATSPEECALCRALGPRQSGSPMEGFSLPAEAGRLVAVHLPNPGTLLRCPHCGTLYQREYQHDCEPFAPETDTESLRRVSFDEVRRAAMEQEFGTAEVDESR